MSRRETRRSDAHGRARAGVPLGVGFRRSRTAARDEPLAVAESPQSYAERDYIRSLIAQGETKAQIERALVAQYGPAVLGQPPAHGFNLTVYILPPALVLIGAAVLAFTLPKWRRRSRAAAVAAAASAQAAPQLSPEDAQRLEDDLVRHQ